MIIVLLGPPGAGKGTLATYLIKTRAAQVLSTGTLLRQEIANQTKLGQQAEAILKAGKLVDDQTILAMVEQTLRQLNLGSDQLILLDGFPRTIVQAQQLDQMLKNLGQTVNQAFYLKASLDTVLTRLSSRQYCPTCQRVYNVKLNPPKVVGVCDDDHTRLLTRADDHEATVKARYETYLHQTQPLIDYYQGQHKLTPLATTELPAMYAEVDATLKKLALNNHD